MTGSKRKFLGFVPRDSIWHPLIKYLVIPIIALIVVFLLVDRVVMPGITRHGSEFPLPSVVGLSFTEAMDTLDQYGVDIYIAGEESSPDIPDGTVMVQTPLPGSMVKTGRRVKVIISSGRELVEVPYMVGFSQRQAELKLREAGLRTGSFNWASSDSLPVNVLVYSVPSWESLVPRNTPINLYFNRGSQSDVVFVPQLVGTMLSDAEQIADSLGLVISKVDFTVNTVVLPNTVIWQSLRAGTKTEIGSYVDLKVAVTD
jgi:beta-lactam-binding protein with PASTA domain